MAKANEVSDLEPTTTTEATIEQNGNMLEITPVTPPKPRRAIKKNQDMIEIDPDAIKASQEALLAESGNSTFQPEASTEPRTESVSTASVSPEPVVHVHNTVVHNTAPQATQGETSRASAVMPNQRLINADFVQKTKAINSVPREQIEQRLDEIDAMFSLRRNSTGATRDNATIMLAMSMWEIMGL